MEKTALQQLKEKLQTVVDDLRTILRNKVREMKHGSLFSGIYEIMNTTTKQCYIGSSINVYKRISSHVSMLRNKKIRVKCKWLVYFLV